MKKRMIEIGKIVKTQGISGEVRVNPWSDSPEVLLEFDRFFLDEGHTELHVERANVHGNIVRVKFVGIDIVEQAELMIGKTIYIARDDAQLPNDIYFVQDLLGLRVTDVDTCEDYGVISEVSNGGAQDIYHVKKGQRVLLVPVIPSVVIARDFEAGVIQIRPLEGLFDPEEVLEDEA